MAYITKSNLAKIRKNIDTQSASILNGSINDLPIDKNLLTGEFRLLSDNEKMWLHCARCLYESFEVFVDKVYKKIEKEDLDSLTYITEGEAPSYHEDQNCQRLKQPFEGEILPEEIKSKGKKVVDEFRIWYKDKIKYNRAISNFSLSEESENKFGVKVVFPLKRTSKQQFSFWR